MIAVTPPKGAYNVVESPFLRKMVKVPGMEEANWYFSTPIYREDLDTARAIGLKAKPSWWHNWPKPLSGSVVSPTISSQCFVLSSGGRADEKPEYMPFPRLGDGWHEPAYADLAVCGDTTSAVMQWGGCGWKQEYTFLAMGWWAWDPARHVWDDVRMRAYGYVYGPGLAHTALDFDNTYRELSTMFDFTFSNDPKDMWFPLLLKDQSQRPAAAKLAARLKTLAAKLGTARADQSFVDPSRFSDLFLTPPAVEARVAAAAVAAPLPEYS
jgi:hypothetical protein